MWEQIRSNKRKSVALVLVMAVLLCALGFIIGQTVYVHAGGGEYRYIGDQPIPDLTGGVVGIAVAVLIWGFMGLTAYFGGTNILMAASGAVPIQKEDHPQLFNIVEEMTIAAGKGKMPKVYIMDDPALNAFATGRDPDHAAVAVTTGLLGKLNRDELQGVIAHEISHIVHRDVLFMTLIGVMVGAIVMISEIFLRGMQFSGGRRSRRARGRGGGQAEAVFLILAIVAAILAPLLARLIYLASSRRREYLADANAAVLTRYPAGLASALNVIRADTRPMARVTRATAPMFIKNPLESGGGMSLFSTHPPIEQRIRVLMNMTGTASFQEYQQAWKRTAGDQAGVLPASALSSGAQQPIRAPVPDVPSDKTAREQLRQAGDLFRKVGQFAFLPCLCGLRIKLPPDFKGDRVQCPRCARELVVPVAQLAALHQVGEAITKMSESSGPPRVPGSAQELEIGYDGKGWKSFRCACGNLMSISPSLGADRVRCGSCGSTIRVRREGRPPDTR